MAYIYYMWLVCVLFFLFTPVLLFILFASLLSFFKYLKAFKSVSVFSILKFNSEGSLCGFLFIQGAECLVCPSVWKRLLVLGLFLEWGCWLFLSDFSFLSRIPFIGIIDLLDQSSDFLIFSFLFSISPIWHHYIKIQVSFEGKQTSPHCLEESWTPGELTMRCNKRDSRAVTMFTFQNQEEPQCTRLKWPEDLVLTIKEKLKYKVNENDHLE